MSWERKELRLKLEFLSMTQRQVQIENPRETIKERQTRERTLGGSETK
jgi:hypothetical protein